MITHFSSEVFPYPHDKIIIGLLYIFRLLLKINFFKILLVNKTKFEKQIAKHLQIHSFISLRFFIHLKSLP
jgi:hypothetical protein